MKDHARKDHTCGELVLGVAGLKQKPEAVLPPAKGLLDEEACGAVTKVKPILSCGTWIEERIQEDAGVIMTTPGGLSTC